MRPNARPLRRYCWGALFLLQGAVADGGDAIQGRQKAAGCANCHGIQGIAAAPNFPNLAAQKEAYLAKAIRAYRSGERNDPIMKGMVAALSEADIDNLAAYFAGLSAR